MRRKGVLRYFTKSSQENNCARVPFLLKLQAYKRCNFIKKETLAQVFFCEFCEICKNIFFYRTPLVAASVGLTAILNIVTTFSFSG